MFWCFTRTPVTRATANDAYPRATWSPRAPHTTPRDRAYQRRDDVDDDADDDGDASGGWAPAWRGASRDVGEERPGDDDDGDGDASVGGDEGV